MRFLSGIAVALVLSTGCTNTPPKPDAGPSTDAGPDAGPADAGPACGAAGEACCSGTTCSSPLTCHDALCEPATVMDVGRPCVVDSTCQSGVCFKLANGDGICTESCATASDCVSGWTCQSLAGVPADVCQCTPTTQTCDGKDDDCDGLVDNQPAANDWCAAQEPGSTCQGSACVCTESCGGTSCVDTTTDLDNCGRCGNVCPSGPDSTPTCASSMCGLTCSSGFANCDGNAANGCEVSTVGDPDNCGACGKTCLAAPPATATCVSSHCVVTGGPDGGIDAGMPTTFCSLPGSYVYDSSGNMTRVGTSPVDLSWLKVPPGFCAHWFGNVGNARQMRFAPGGELFVASPTDNTTSGGQNGLGAIVVLPDDNQDGYADLADGGSSAGCGSCCQYTTFLGGDGTEVPVCAGTSGSLEETQGIMFTPDWVYYQDDTCIRRLPYTTGERISTGGSDAGTDLCARVNDRDPLDYGYGVIDITLYASGGHWPKAVDIADDGTVYVTNGGDQGEQCIEPDLDSDQMPFHGGIWEVNGTPGGEPIVKGLRNAIGLRCQRGHDNCFAVELAEDYSWNAPGSEKLLLVHAGDNWGYPCCADLDLDYIAGQFPDGGIEYTMAYGPSDAGMTPLGRADCSKITPTTNGFEIAETPFGLDFAPDSWPNPWSSDVIVVLHGQFSSWDGARVVSIETNTTTGIPLPTSDLDGGMPAAQSNFATGWDDGHKDHGRPAGIAVSSDGRAFISNDQNGDIVWIAPIGAVVPDASTN